MNHLDTCVSRFNNYGDKTGKPVRLGEFLMDATHKNAVTRIREMASKEDRDEAKFYLPCIMVSCLSETRAAGIPTGLQCVDFDEKANHGIDWPSFVTKSLSQIPFITYAGLSVSGRGCFAIIPVSNPNAHHAHFKSLVDYFKRCGVVADSKVNYLNALRGYSYNDETTSFHNPKAITYTGQAQTPQSKPYQKPTGQDAVKVQAVVNRIVAEKRDVTEGYDNWISVAQSLAIAFGESGRSWFHQLSSIHPDYDAAKTDSKYSSFLDKGYDKVGLGTFFHICDSR